jgi:hypothetical protein
MLKAVGSSKTLKAQHLELRARVPHSGARCEKIDGLINSGQYPISAVIQDERHLIAGEYILADRPFDFESHIPDADDLQRSYKALRAVYLTAISFATVGWLWLIASLATYLFEATM